MKVFDRVQLAHGGGGHETNELINKVLKSGFAASASFDGEDAAVLTTSSKIAMSTDSFTVSPHTFPGGNIGSLAIAGTCNDLSMVAARPKFLSCSFILEEGLPIATLRQVVSTMASELEKIDAKIVCGDTKVVPKGSVDQIFINTTGIGEVMAEGVSAAALKPSDSIIVSRDIGCHGACILAQRESIKLDHDIMSDCALLWPAVEALLNQGLPIHSMRDATRGGIAAVMQEWCAASDVQIELKQEQIPISEPVRGICELFGVDPFDLANEGTFVVAVPKLFAEQTVEVLRHFNPTAAVVGEVVDASPKQPILTSATGAKRIVDCALGELLPRIC